MKFCFNCGEAIEDNTVVCPKCQTRLQETNNEPTGLLGSGYNRVAESWKDLADTASSKLWELRIKAIVFIAIGIGSSIGVYKTKKIAKKEN